MRAGPPAARSVTRRSKPARDSYPLSFSSMLSSNGFTWQSRALATSRAALVAVVLAVAAGVLVAAPARADPMTVCPPNQSTYWNGQPCFPQPCVPPYAPGIPPCFMPAPQIGPNGVPVFG